MIIVGYSTICQDKSRNIDNNYKDFFTLSNIQQRIVELRQSLGIERVSVFAQKLDIKRTTIIGYEDGSSPPSAAFLVKLHEIYNVNINWLLLGEGEMFLESQEKSPNPPENISPGAIIDQRFEKLEAQIAEIEARLKETGLDPPEKPVSGLHVVEPEPEYGEEDPYRVLYVDNIAAGPPIQQSEDLSQHIDVPARFIKTSPEDYYAARIRGESMSAAGIPDGCTVLIRRSDVPRDGAIQVVRNGRRSTLKRMREGEDHTWALHYEDDSERLIPIKKDEEYQVQGDFVAVLPEKGKSL
jgi:SOS-response transcriptional repressor LexA